jgi:acyl carrier protein
VDWIEVEKAVHSCIKQVAADRDIVLSDLSPSQRVVDDLGFSSLDVATLTAILEATFRFDPFGTGMVTITEIRTVRDICDVYHRGVNGIEAPKNSKSEDIDDAEMLRLQKRLRSKLG